MLAHKLITELKSLGFTGSAGDMLKKYLRDRFTLPDATINDLLKDGLNTTDVNSALAVLVADAADGLTPATPTDPYFANVVSLLHFDGNLTDVKGKTWTAVGNANVNGTAKFGSNALATDGTSDYVTCVDSEDFNLGSVDFTIEGWVRITTETLQYGVLAAQWSSSASNRGWAVFLPNSSAGEPLYFQWSTNGADAPFRSFTWNPTTGVYYHVAVCRDGNNLRAFVDGTQIGTTQSMTGVTIYNSTRNIDVGGSGDSGVFGYNGFLDEFRFTKGVARYKADFTPPTSAFPDA